jgi:hypothetical protein
MREQQRLMAYQLAEAVVAARPNAEAPGTCGSPPGFQAQIEDPPIVTNDEVFDGYGVTRWW